MAVSGRRQTCAGPNEPTGTVIGSKQQRGTQFDARSRTCFVPGRCGRVAVPSSRGEPMRSERSTLWTPALAAPKCAALAIAGVAQAAGPERFGPFVNDYADVGISCDGFDIFIEGTETRTATVFRDDQGEVIRVIERVSAPHDVLTNTITGDSIVVRAH